MSPACFKEQLVKISSLAAAGTSGAPKITASKRIFKRLQMSMKLNKFISYHQQTLAACTVHD
jgi:hypothetical protein